MNSRTYWVVLLLGVFYSGCIPSQPLMEGDVNRYWSLTQKPTDENLRRLENFGGKVIPTRWTIHQQPSVIWSTVSIVRAVDRIKTGATEIEFSISLDHTKAIENILAEIRLTIEELSQLAESGKYLCYPG